MKEQDKDALYQDKDTIYYFEKICRVLDSPLSVEILYSAMIYLKAYPNADIEEAITHGFIEWDAV